MIIAKLFGGLGNQMFIYATTKALALKSGQDYSFDVVTGFKDDYKFKRDLLLSYFPAALIEAPHKLSFQYFGGRLFRKISRFLGFCIPFFNIRFICEQRPYIYHCEYFDMAKKGELYIEGYFQSYRYFHSIRKELLKDFSFSEDLKLSVSDEAKLICDDEFVPVAMGVRRYQEMKGEFGELTIVPASFYEHAVNCIKKKIINPKLFIFSEDMNWVQSNLQFDIPVYYVKPKSGKLSALQDMYLMSICNHHIISNSTFYWWGAYLSNKENNIVIVPNNFLNRDCTLEEWIVIE